MRQQEGINTKLVVIGLIISMFFSSLEQTIVGTAMPSIIADLNGFTIFAWVTTAYLIASTAVTPIVGKLSDQYGRRFLYLTGVLIFIISSALCATASTMEQLVVYRGLQGIGSGMIMPLSQTIIGDIFTPERRAKWKGVFGAIFGLSSVIGPFIGGFLVDAVNWHWIFLINVPFGLLAAILIFVGLKNEIVSNKEKATVDFLGIFTLIPALILLLLTLTFGGDKFAWNSFMSLLLFGSSLLFILLFVFVESKAKEPILDLALFKNRVFVTTNGLGFLLGLGMFGTIMFVPMFMQAILGVTPTQAGSTMTPMMVSLIVASIIGGRLLLKIRYRTVLTLGMLITMLGFYLMSTMGIHTKELTAYLYMIILGLGMGLVMPTLMIAVQNEFPKSKLGAVTAATTFFRSIGGTIGITILNAVMKKSLETNMSEVTNHATTTEVTQVLQQLGQETNTLFRILVNPELLPVPSQLKEAVITSIKIGWAQSFNAVFLAGLIFLSVGIIVALSVGDGKIKRDEKPNVVLEEKRIAN